MQESLKTILESQQMVYEKIKNTYATKEETKGKIELWQPETDYKVGDVVIGNFNNDETNKTFIAICNEDHTSAKNTEYNNGFTNDIIMHAVWDTESIKAEYDGYGRNIYDTYATKTELGNIQNLLMNCNIVKLNKKNAETDANNYFDIEPNMLIMATAGDNKCINYTVATGTKIEGTNEYERQDKTTGANMILALSVKSNEQVEGTTEHLNAMHRVSCMSYSTTSFMSVEIPKVEVKNNFVSKPRIENSSTSADVYVYYIKQG